MTEVFQHEKANIISSAERKQIGLVSRVQISIYLKDRLGTELTVLPVLDSTKEATDWEFSTPSLVMEQLAAMIY